MTPTTYHALWQSLTPLYETGEAQAIVRLLLEDAFGLTMADVLCGGIDSMTSTQIANLDGMMRRLQNAEPIQYVLGQTEFCGRMFHVGQGVADDPHGGDRDRAKRPAERPQLRVRAQADRHRGGERDIQGGGGCQHPDDGPAERHDRHVLPSDDGAGGAAFLRRCD